MSMVRRKRDFKHMERVKGKMINIVEGLELHTGVFNPSEQKQIVDCVYQFQKMGREGRLRERTYSEPRKWMRGKGPVTIQFGCCYNYAMDKDGNPPGIIRHEDVDPIPPLLKDMIKRMVEWRVLPASVVPDSCIINIYDRDDCIPPHIDHHDFVRPFCTASFLTKSNILFGMDLKVIGPGDFSGPVAIPLLVRSVLVLNGNGAEVAKHCIPAVPAKRISITFRKMDRSKVPYSYAPDPDLMNLPPISDTSSTLDRRIKPAPAPEASGAAVPAAKEKDPGVKDESRGSKKMVLQWLTGGSGGGGGNFFTQEDFPPLGGGAKPKRPPLRQ